jgi:hypothetical protein
VERTKKEAMWYKIQDLSKSGYNKSQISRELSIDRGTVSKYLKMSKIEFDRNQILNLTREKKLEIYYDQVENMLVECSDLSASQIGDRLRELNKDFGNVSQRTIFSFVQYVRNKSNIPKETGSKREYEKVLELPYGLQGQCDFGSCWMQKESGKIKVYFMAIVLSRSRAKYTYYQSKPFTTLDAITAHKRAFAYFGGCPQEIWYDQDRVFAVDENLGDYKFTEEFKKYVAQEVFTPRFCKKADPESKGKIENVVKYIKGNFLKGRKYITIDLLQEQSDQWLARTGNGKVHEGTKLIPLEELKIERSYLKTPKNDFELPKINGTVYKLRKDNTVCYKSNWYTVPTGTYKDDKSIVELKVEGGLLYIFNDSKDLITSHYISALKGKTITKSDHRRDKSTSLNEKLDFLKNKLDNDEKCVEYLNKLRELKPRNIHDELQNMLRISREFSDRELKDGIHLAYGLEIYNSNDIRTIITNKIKEEKQGNDNLKESPLLITNILSTAKYKDMAPIKSSIKEFENIF